MAIYITKEVNALQKPSHTLNGTVVLVLSSLNTVTKEATSVSRRLRRASPHPGFGSQIELSGRHPRRLLDLLGVGKALAS